MTSKLNVAGKFASVASAALMIVLLWGCAEQAKAPIVIENLYIKELPPAQTTAAAYMKVTNNTDKTQALNYIHSPAAEYVEVHRNIYKDGVMQMRPVKKLTVGPGQTKVLDPGGFHLMIFGLYENYKAGDTFELTLEFESGAVVTTDVEVRPHG